MRERDTVDSELNGVGAHSVMVGEWQNSLNLGCERL
jgi:hypothetical protein